MAQRSPLIYGFHQKRNNSRELVTYVSDGGKAKALNGYVPEQRWLTSLGKKDIVRLVNPRLEAHTGYQLDAEDEVAQAPDAGVADGQISLPSVRMD